MNWVMVVGSVREIGEGDFKALFATLPLVMLTTYFLMYGLVPRFSRKEKRALSVLLLPLVLIGMGVSIRIIRYLLLPPSEAATFSVFAPGLILGEIFRWLSVISFAVMIKVIKSKIILEQQNELLHKEKRDAELNFLKAHMHPHFLFNTLNTLYGETIKESNGAGKIVLQLSNLLRFTLEECNKRRIPLKKELQAIKDYIDLEKLRHGSRLNVMLDHSDADERILISPLLLLPFVENSFKHTLNNIRGRVAISINVTSGNGILQFRIENDLVERFEDRSVPHFQQGISNVRRQLDLLYDTNYELKVEDINRKFCVTLRMPAMETMYE